ncbi:MAG: cob(I)yrinic acid a,c-diamide adenosyltransferase [Bacteroidales bacterium]|nr:cob(I)yrinic acid a,c-diamide adenosyltransferase [Lentimicrobiaceae bacterium]MDD5695634.1 cob(I)yrinic acid a,c-diamide adenosyltransferase [Bacteroidales bacterium]
MINRGYIHVYTGNGKGKTTAALGLALRAAGAGKQVLIAQFVKGNPYSEIELIERHLPSINIKQYGLGCFIVNAPTAEDIQAARSGLQQVAELMASGKYNLIILDEATIALYYNLFSMNELIQVIQSRPEETEIVITGRYAPSALIEIADLVTEMNEVKHYYSQGVTAKKGIEY